MENNIAKKHLEDLLMWAKDKAHSGSEPPWAWYQYMKLIETAESILGGMNSTLNIIPKENLPLTAKPQGNVHQLAAGKRRIDTSQPHLGNLEPQMPM
jgi:hypothetical protein